MKQVGRARYEANLAQRRYMQVEPENRLVADTLEAEWNQKLQALAEARLECERLRSLDRQLLDQEKREKIMALASNFPPSLKKRTESEPTDPDGSGVELGAAAFHPERQPGTQHALL